MFYMMMMMMMMRTLSFSPGSLSSSNKTLAGRGRSSPLWSLVWGLNSRTDSQPPPTPPLPLSPSRSPAWEAVQPRTRASSWAHTRSQRGPRLSSFGSFPKPTQKQKHALPTLTPCPQ